MLKKVLVEVKTCKHLPSFPLVEKNADYYII